MAEDKTSTPERTTLVGGVLLAIAGVIGLLGSVRFTIPLPEASILFESVIPATVSNILLLAAFITLAMGTRGETGIVGRSVLGRLSLILFGGGYLVFTVYALLPVSSGSGGAIVGGMILEVLVIVAGVIAGVVTRRARLLHGAARWMLLAVGIWNAIWSIPAFIPNTDLALSLAIWKVDILMPAALIVLSVTYMVHGRSAAIRHRLHVINENW